MEISQSFPFQTLPPGIYLRWVWSDASESWVCGEPNNGAGVFYESGDNPECSAGFYFSTVVGGEIKDIASGPFETRSAAMDAAGQRFRSLMAGNA